MYWVIGNDIVCSFFIVIGILTTVIILVGVVFVTYYSIRRWLIRKALGFDVIKMLDNMDDALKQCIYHRAKRDNHGILTDISVTDATDVIDAVIKELKEQYELYIKSTR